MPSSRANAFTFSWGCWPRAGPPPSYLTTGRYIAYLELAERVAKEAEVSPNVVEYTLFHVGKQERGFRGSPDPGGIRAEGLRRVVLHSPQTALCGPGVPSTASSWLGRQRDLRGEAHDPELHLWAVSCPRLPLSAFCHGTVSRCHRCCSRGIMSAAARSPGCICSIVHQHARGDGPATPVIGMDRLSGANGEQVLDGAGQRGLVGVPRVAVAGGPAAGEQTCNLPRLEPHRRARDSALTAAGGRREGVRVPRLCLRRPSVTAA
jgi:hypothetical protein